MNTDPTTTRRPLAVNPYAPPRAAVRDIVSPMADEPADRGTRLAATLLDSLVIGAMVSVPMLVAIMLAPTNGESGGAFAGVALAASVVGFVVWAWLTIKYVVANGQTIGKKMLSIKVVRSDGSPASFSRIFWLRNVVNGAIGIIPGYALVDILFIFGESRQCLHDKIADTIVVKA